MIDFFFFVWCNPMWIHCLRLRIRPQVFSVPEMFMDAWTSCRGIEDPLKKLILSVSLSKS